jgi:hypothetical protein
MQLEELLEMKSQLEKDILSGTKDLISIFESETGLSPCSINFRMLDVSTLSGRAFVVEDCVIKVEI